MPTNIREAFSTYLRQQFGLTEMQLSQWERIADGWETDVYAYQLITPQRTEDKILRIFMGDSLAKARREYNGMSALHRLGYPVPQVSHLCEDANVLGGPFILMQRIFGQAIGRVMHQDDTLFGRFIGLLVELHELPIVPLHESAGLVSTLAEAWQTKLAWTRKVVLEQFRQTWAAPILDWLDANTPYFPVSARLAILHNDFHPFNVLITEAGELFVIDWANIGIGDARTDLAWTILLMTTNNQSPDMRDWILEEYCTRTNQPAIDIDIFEVFAATRRLIDLAMTLGAGAEAMGMRPETVATMRQQAGHYRAVYDILHTRTDLRVPVIETLLDQLENEDNPPT